MSGGFHAAGEKQTGNKKLKKTETLTKKERRLFFCLRFCHAVEVVLSTHKEGLNTEILFP